MEKTVDELLQKLHCFDYDGCLDLEPADEPESLDWMDDLQEQDDGEKVAV
jgi:hypothetical protein